MHYILYAVTLLISSSMLFVVQPMVAKMVQPVLGGTPAVWNTAMVFFQALLLGGYLYAHVTTKWLGTRRQAVVHLVVLAVGLLFLPIVFDPPTDPASLQYPALWLLTTLLIGVGWPFFVISTSAPLLQKWFSTIDHPRAADPYHLYAASNAGSVFALVAYPFLIEPRIGLALQSSLWMIAYITLCVSVAVCAVILWRSPPRKANIETDESPPASAVALTWIRRGRWILWAFIPSSMMLGVTTFITTDIAPMPLLWIPPLAIYIFSFIIVFARKIYIPMKVWVTLFPVFFLSLATVFMIDVGGALLGFATIINFLGLFVFCMVFHGYLAEDRPHTDHLTEFYLLMSVGGVLGGVFNALIAPVVFNRLLEYPTLLLVAAVALPVQAYCTNSVRWALGATSAACVLFILWFYLVEVGDGTLYAILSTIFFGAIFLPVLVALKKPQVAPVALGLFALIITFNDAMPQQNELHHERSFFATHQVMENPEEGYNEIIHGATIHGRQYLDDDLRRRPASYHNEHGPLGQVIDELRTRPERHPIAAVGLGAGAVATYTEPGQTMDFFEIDPAVKRIALNPEFFTYLHDCRGECPIIMGDGRLQMQIADDSRYELLILDAYSSTAVPVHLLTREALEIYLDKLRPGGILAFHISNRHLDLEPPLTKLAAELGLVSRVQKETQMEMDEDRPKYAQNSDWVVMARDEESLGSLIDDERWLDVPPRDDLRTWTDDYANVLQIVRFLQRFTSE